LNASRPSNCDGWQRQFSVVAGPRYHLNLLNQPGRRNLAGFSFARFAKCENSRELTRNLIERMFCR